MDCGNIPEYPTHHFDVHDLVVNNKYILVFVLSLTHFVLLILVYHPKHYIRDLRIELPALAFLDLLSYRFLRKRLSVTSVACHSVIRVRYADYPRYLGYICALKSAWIACAVVTLMVELRAVAYALVSAYIPQDMIAAYRVYAYPV